MSSNTGAYNKARQRLPAGAVEGFCDHLFAQLSADTNGLLPAIGRRAFLFDGTTVRTPHTKDLTQLYPPTSNQHGESHWPLIRMLVAHDLVTGLGMRPASGAVNGPNAVSEQRLFEQAVARLPEHAVVVGDRNFGVFSVAYKVGRRLREHALHARTVQIKFRYSDFSTFTRAQSLDHATQLDTEIYQTARALFDSNWQAGRAIRLIGVHTSGFEETEGQLDLLGGDRSEKLKRIFTAADALRDKFGDASVSLAGGMKGRFRERVHDALSKKPEG